MKVEIIHKKHLLITPETDFESKWLEDYNPDQPFLKYGLMGSDFLGIKIPRKPNKPVEPTASREEGEELYYNMKKIEWEDITSR